MTEPADPRKWQYRRLAVYGSAIGSFLIIGIAVWKDSGGPAAVSAVTGLTGFLTFMLLSYIFAPSLEAVWGPLTSFLSRSRPSDDRADS